MIPFHPDTTVHGFRVLREGEVPRLDARYSKLIHEASGATLYYSDRDDGQLVFSVGFRTLPEDDTGVFHILEHSCLDGSEHFPLKEPFVNLLKTSMAVELNAMTYEDKTVYFFISTNEQDYMNLLSVYLDAVFYPLLRTDRRIFDKEAWHLEPDGAGGVSISGVVFNEMQGNDNQPDYLMWLQNEKQLFPDLSHIVHNSGGDPAAIPDLTYEHFVKTYERFYSTQNAVFYLSGSMDLDRALAYLDRVLTEKGRSTVEKPAPAPLQAPVVSSDGTAYYQLADNEDIAGNTHLMLTYVLEEDKSEEVLAFSLLSRYLAENTESPLERAVLAADVGRDFDMVADGDYRQPLVYFTMGKSDPDMAEPFRLVIVNTLASLVRDGLDHDRLRALVDGHETDCRRAALSVKTGFRLMESFIRAHVQYDDADPVDDLATLRQRLAEDEDYFEHLIEKYILHSNHWALTKCIPSRTLTAERRERMNARFAAESDRLAAIPGGYDALITRVETLNDYLTTPDSPEAEATVPHLTPADLDLSAEVRDMAVEPTLVGECEAVSLHYETDAAGMVMAGLLFDLSSIPEGDLFYAACLRDALLDLPTEVHTLSELSDRWVDIHTNAHTGLRVETTERAYLTLVLDAPAERIGDAVALLDEYIRLVRFDRGTLREIFANASDVRNRMVRNGHLSALRLATRTLTTSGMYHEYTSGLSFYRRLCDLADRFDESGDDLIDGMARVWTQLTETVRPVAFLTGSQEAYAAWKQALAATGLGHAIPAEAPNRRPTPMARKNAALTIPGEVNYCAEVYSLADVGETFSPRLQVIHTYLYSRYFWDEIRAKGGAYGANATAFRQGIIGYTSYRDPRVADTYAVYGSLSDWLDENIPDADAVDAIIVSTVGSTYFAPRSEIDLGNMALNRYLVGMSAADRRAEMEDILATSPADFAAYAATVRRLTDGGHAIRTALGGAGALRRSGLFAEDEITEL